MTKLYTDTSANLPLALLREYDIAVIPFSYTVNGVAEDYNEETDFDGKAFYDAMRRGAEVKTSMVNPATAAAFFERALAQGDDVLYVGMSGGISGTAHAAALAAEELREKYPERTIYVVDTLCASRGEGLLVWYACKKRDEGMTLDELHKWVEDTKLHLCHWFTVDDLMYLKRGGRISAATALVGTMLKVKPVLHVDNDGHLINMFKVRGRKASLEAIANKLGELGGNYDNSTVFICHGDCIEDAKYVENILKTKYGVKEVLINYTGAVIGSHSGPGTMAVFFLGNHR